MLTLLLRDGMFDFLSCDLNRVTRESLFLGLPTPAAVSPAQARGDRAPPQDAPRTPPRIDASAQLASMLALHSRVQSSLAAVLRELQRDHSSTSDIDAAARAALECSKQLFSLNQDLRVQASLTQQQQESQPSGPSTSSALVPGSPMHVALAVMLRNGPQKTGLWGPRGNVPASAVESLLEAYTKLAQSPEAYRTLASTEGLLQGLVQVLATVLPSPRL